MDSIRILHTADIHIDNGFTASNFPYYLIEERQKDIRNTFDRIIEIALLKKVDLLLISGDLLEHKFVQLKTIQYINHKLSTLQNTYVFILPGNHDPYHMVNYYKNFHWASNIIIFDNEYKKIHLKDLGVVVHGIGFGYQEEKRPLLETIKCSPSQDINILMLHGSEMTQGSLKQSNYLPFHYGDLINSGFDYIALGHYHQYKLYEDLYGNPIAAYPGSPEPLGFDEVGKHGVILGEISKEQNKIHRISIANREYFKLTLDVTNCSNLQDIKDRIIHETKPMVPEKNIFLIGLKGYYSWAEGLTIEFLEKELGKIFYYIRILDDTEPCYDIDSLIGEKTIISSYILEIQDKIKHEKDEKRRSVLKRALTIGIDALRGGGYE